jgi:hypothetical protein
MATFKWIWAASALGSRLPTSRKLLEREVDFPKSTDIFSDESRRTPPFPVSLAR